MFREEISMLDSLINKVKMHGVVIPEYKEFHCISIRQPWAFEIITGSKIEENRTWDTKYRGRLYIQVSKTIGDQFAFNNIYHELHTKLKNGMIDLLTKTFGMIIGYVDLVDVVKVGKKDLRWKLENPVIIKNPILCIGRLGIFKLKEEEEAYKKLILI